MDVASECGGGSRQWLNVLVLSGQRRHTSVLCGAPGWLIARVLKQSDLDETLFAQRSCVGGSAEMEVFHDVCGQLFGVVANVCIAGGWWTCAVWYRQ